MSAFLSLGVVAPGAGVLNSNHAAAPVIFGEVNTTNKHMLISWMGVQYKFAGDPSTNGFAGGAALINGLQIVTVDPDLNIVRDFLDGDYIYTDFDWNIIADTVDFYPVEGIGPFATPGAVAAKMKFINSGAPVSLPPEHAFGLLLNDDLTTITSGSVHLQCQSLSLIRP